MIKRLKHGWIFALVVMGLLACTPTEEALPTLVPTATEAPATATASPIPLPTNTPTATPNIPRTISADPNLQSYARVVHAHAALPAVDVYLDGLLFAPYLEYGQHIEATGIEAGTYALTVYPVGERTPPALAEKVVTINALKTINIILYEDAGLPSTAIFEEDMRPITGEQSRISLINAMPTSAEVMIQEGTQALLNTSGGGQLSPARLINSGEFSYNLRVDGTILRGTRQRIAPRESYTFVITAPSDDLTNVRVITLRSRLSGLAQVRVVNIAEDNSLELLVNNTVLGEQLGTHYVTDYQELPSGDYDLRVYASDSDRESVEPLILARFSPLPNERITLIIIGKGNDLRVVTHRANSKPTNLGTARLFVVHGLYDTPRIQGETVSETTISLTYGQVSTVGEIPMGNQIITWRDTRNSQSAEVIQTVEVQLREGTEYLYVFSGRDDLPLILLDERVNTLAVTPSPAEIAAQPTPVLPPVIRPINAITGLTVEFRVDDAPIARGIASRAGAGATTLLSGERVLTVLNNDTQQLLARIITTLESGKEYVFIVYGRVETGFDIMLLEEERFGIAPTIRLINLSPISSAMGIAYNVSNNLMEPFPDLRTINDPVAVSTQEVLDENGNVIGFETILSEATYRMSIMGGLIRHVNDIALVSASPVAPITGGAGIKDFYVLDNFTASISNVLPNITVREGVHYDIIAIQERNSFFVDAFIVPYTRP